MCKSERTGSRTYPEFHSPPDFKEWIKYRSKNSLSVLDFNAQSEEQGKDVLPLCRLSLHTLVSFAVKKFLIGCHPLIEFFKILLLALEEFCQGSQFLCQRDGVLGHFLPAVAGSLV
ncbi:hypothetical protein H1C71_028402 [Ictidomys tridecemlineatus]|nr:hypothetical protein H1C71_028402 [Ictidomys tridecemlineatus]